MISTVEIDGVKFRCWSSGFGCRVVVIACDPPTVLEQLMPIFKGLDNVIAFEQPGFGFSQVDPSFDFSFEAYLQAVNALLDHFGRNEYILAFPCTSSHIAIRLASSRKNIGGLVLTQATAWERQAKWAWRLDPTRLTYLPIIGPAFYRVFPRWISQRWYTSVASTPENQQLLAEPTNRAFKEGAFFCLSSMLRTWFLNSKPEFSPVTQPTVMLWAENDPSHLTIDAGSLLPLVPNASLLRMQGLGHYPEIEDPQRYCQAIQTFLKSECDDFRARLNSSHPETI